MDVNESWVPFPETATCPLCGGYANLKKTRNRRVSAYCSRCSSRVFLNSWPALCGYLTLSDQVDAKRKEWMAAMDAEAAKRKMGPQKSIEEADRVVAKENMQRAMQGDQNAVAWLGQFSDGMAAFAEFANRGEVT